MPRRMLPGSFRIRLVLAFALVVAIALGLVLAALPRLLDGYFAQQEQNNLATRTAIISTLLRARLNDQLMLENPEERPRPILMPTTPLDVSPMVRRALGGPDSGFVKTLTDFVAQSNVEVTIADARAPTQPVYGIFVPLGRTAISEAVAKGQQRDRISYQDTFRIADPFWTAGGSAPVRLVTVRLSDPFTYRAKTLETVIGVMFAAAGLALAVAVVASLLLANRLTIPIRRLTAAARQLSEGNLGARVPAPASGSPEINELADSFNLMAERLEQSVGYIRRDRDRTREFLADASHELRTPLAALRTFNELLTNGAAANPDTRVEFLESSRQQIERLDWLASNLLEMSRLDSGLAALDLRPDDLRAVVENAVHQAEPAAKERGVELTMELPQEPIRQGHDPQRLGQVMVNLLGNAVKFTPRGGRVTASLRRTADGAELRVADTGVGIDPSELPHVFERFYRGSRSDGAGGAGLGLSIVRSIVDMHGGRVEIASAPDSGTEVVVQLPRDVAVSSPASGPS